MSYTYRQKYTEEYEALSTRYKAMQTAYTDLVEGRIVSYTLGNRSVTRSSVSLKELTDAMSAVRLRMSELEAILNGRPVRKTTRHVFVDPAMTPWFKRGF